tara:strand:+ start:395 stop:583 length:189 start_codon:yes stop_codon:yes gene_type:complete
MQKIKSKYTDIKFTIRYDTFLTDFTGLKIGESTSEESLRSFYLNGMKKFQEKIEKKVPFYPI